MSSGSNIAVASQPQTGWRELAGELGGFYHEPAWIDALRSAFGFRTYYLGARDGGELTGILPLAEVPALLGPRRLVSLPFSFAAGPVGRSSEIVEDLCAAAVDLARSRGISRIELKHWSSSRIGSAQFQRVSRYNHYRIHTREGSERVWSSLHSSVRRGISKARKTGMRVVRGDAREQWRTVAELQERTSRRLGLPAPGRRFFEDTCRALQAQGMSDLYLALLPDGDPAAAVVIWKHPSSWIYAFGPSRPEYLQSRPVHLLLSEVLEDAVRSGVELDLGRAAPEQEGLVEFKRRWGGVEYRLDYDYWPRAAGLNVQSRVSGPMRLTGKVWSALPLAITRRAAFLYRYIG